MSIFTLRPHLFHEIVEPVPGVGQEVRLRNLMREREDTRANLRANKAAAQHSADPGPNHRRRSNTDAISWQEVTSGTTHIQRMGSNTSKTSISGRAQGPGFRPRLSQGTLGRAQWPTVAATWCRRLGPRSASSPLPPAPCGHAQGGPVGLTAAPTSSDFHRLSLETPMCARGPGQRPRLMSVMVTVPCLLFLVSCITTFFIWSGRQSRTCQEDLDSHGFSFSNNLCMLPKNQYCVGSSWLSKALHPDPVLPTQLRCPCYY